MTRVVNVTQTYIIDGETVKEDTFPITDMTSIEEVGCPPVVIDGFGKATLEVRFTFDPPLIVPGGDS